MPPGMLDDDPLDHVGRILARIDGVLEEGVDLLPLDHLDGIGSVIGEEVRDRLAADAIALVLEPMDLDPMRRDVLEALELLECTDQLLALLHDDLGLLVRHRCRLLDLVEDAGVGDLLDEVEHVVQAADQLVDVLAVERRDEGVLELLADVVADGVAAALRVPELARQALTLLVGTEELLEHPGSRQDVLTVLDEELEELLLAWNEGKAHGRVGTPVRARPMASPSVHRAATERSRSAGARCSARLASIGGNATGRS